jgi:hypothetical protein
MSNLTLFVNAVAMAIARFTVAIKDDGEQSYSNTAYLRKTYYILIASQAWSRGSVSKG